MKLSEFQPEHRLRVIELFTQVFSQSESEQEGELIGQLVTELIDTTDPKDLLGMVITDNNHTVVGGLFLSRFTLPGRHPAYLLSPVAIATEVQGNGLGQRLITQGIHRLTADGAELVFTYGDPNFYSKVGFEPVCETPIAAPYALSCPEGWLGRSLTGQPLPTLKGPTHCVRALQNQAYW